jgi:hypothetical protein
MPDDKRVTYERPRALRLRDTHSAAGECFQPGSGDQENCDSTGNSAVGEGCDYTGQSALGDCGYSGFSATGVCVASGAAPGVFPP